MINKLVMAVGWIMDKLDSCRNKYLSTKLNSSFDKGVRLGQNILLAYPSNIVIGENTYINGGTICASKNAKIIIGSNCLISYNVHIRTDTHAYMKKDILINKQQSIEKDIIIEDDCWIGYGAQIMAGVTVRRGSVIGAGAILTKDTEPFGVYAGVPARKIKERKK